MSRPTRNNVSASLRSCWLVCSLSLLALADQAAAQGFSYDGNRWYEVEISIFRHNTRTSEYHDPPLPAQVELGYPAAIRSLQTPLDALAFDFAADREPLSSIDSRVDEETSPFGPGFDAAYDLRQPASAADNLSAAVLGPPPALSKRDFKLPDPDRDAFLQISEMAGEFDRHNQRLRRSSEHRLLYHAVWRQPVLNRVQAEAILIRGGDQYDQHHELEGSIMLSFNVNRIDVDARLWVATFRQGRQSRQMSQFEDNRRPSRAQLASRGLREQRDVVDTTAFSLPPVPITAPTSLSGSAADRSSGGTSGFSANASTSPPAASNRSERRSLAGSPSRPRTEGYRVTELGYMEQRRSVTSNQLHYLDHPDFGVLIELRPYQLPDSLSMDSPLE